MRFCRPIIAANISRTVQMLEIKLSTVLNLERAGLITNIFLNLSEN